MDTWVDFVLGRWRNVRHSARHLPSLRASRVDEWNALDPEYQADIVDRINAFLGARDDLHAAEELERATGPNPLDRAQLLDPQLNYAAEQAVRPTWEEYVHSRDALQDARQLAGTATRRLMDVWPKTPAHHRVTYQALSKTGVEIQEVQDAAELDRRAHPDDKHMIPALLVRRKQALNRTVADEFASGRWVGGWELGSGGFGTVSLFLKLDRSDRVIDVSPLHSCYESSN